MSKNRVIVVVNKWWECIPVLDVLLNKNVPVAKSLPWPSTLNYPLPFGTVLNKPRAIYELSNNTVEIWCISDLLAIFPQTPEYQSSSKCKMDVMGNIFSFESRPADLLIAVGTAASYPDKPSRNGSVIVGTSTFMHDGHPEAQKNHYDEGPFDVIITSKLSKRYFDSITSFENELSKNLMISPNLPADGSGKIHASYDYVTLANINVWNYLEYEEKDLLTLASYKVQEPEMINAVSLETTPPLIRQKGGDSPFLFISGIVDRVGHFNEDVNPAPYVQNTVGAHNAGIVLAAIMVNINKNN